MRFWSRIFRSPKREKYKSPGKIESGADHDWTRANCGFCGRQQIEYSESARYPYPVYRCVCTAIGSGGRPADFDEVADQLLDILRINARVSEPLQPAGLGIISMQHYDAQKVEQDLGCILQRHGYEFRGTKWNKRNCDERLFWVRRSSHRDRLRF
jgi:hypothetical protein